MKKIILGIAILVVLVLLVWLVLKPSPKEESVQAKETAPLPVETPVPDQDPSSKDSEALSQYTPEEIENFEYSHKAALAANQNVIFYGQCVDQDGVPIEGVVVEAKITKMRKSMVSVVVTESFKYTDNLEDITGSDGRFEFKSKGSSLTLQKMEKAGYKIPEKSLYKGYQFGQVLYGSAMAGMHKADPLKPVVFTMWKKGQANSGTIEPKTKSGYRADIGMGKENLGKSYYFDLSKATPVNGPSTNALEVVASNSGNRRRDPESGKFVGSTRYAWSYTLRMPNGGLIKTDDPFLYRPPESGYKKDYSLKIPENEKDWVGRVAEQKFYYKTAEGNYGAFILDVRASAVGGVGIRFERIYYNPTGERNLEPPVN